MVRISHAISAESVSTARKMDNRRITGTFRIWQEKPRFQSEHLAGRVCISLVSIVFLGGSRPMKAVHPVDTLFSPLKLTEREHDAIEEEAAKTREIPKWIPILLGFEDIADE